jgi:hypothetical protein
MTMLQIGRERLLLFGALAGLSLLVFDRLLLTPALTAWQERADEIQRVHLNLAQGAAVVDQESRWLRWRTEMAARLLPAQAGDAESALLGRVDQWARSAGLTVSSLRPRWRDRDQRLPVLELQVAGNGTLGAVANFLYHVETSTLAVAVEHLELVPHTAEGTDLGLDLRLSALCQGAAGKGGVGP